MLYCDPQHVSSSTLLILVLLRMSSVLLETC